MPHLSAGPRCPEPMDALADDAVPPPAPLGGEPPRLPGAEPGVPGHAAAWPPAPPPGPDWMGYDPTLPAPRWGCGDIAYALLAWLLGQIAFALPAALLTTDLAVVTAVGIVGSWVGLAGWTWFAARMKGFGSLAVDFGFRIAWVDVAVGLGAGFGILYAAAIARAVVSQLFGDPVVGNAEAIFGSDPSTAGLLLLAVLAAFGAPIVEELFFRGLALRALERRFNGATGTIGTTLLFAVMHFQLGSLGSVLGLLAGIAVFGVGFAHLVRWRGRLGTSIVAHMTINVVATAVFVAEQLS